MATPMRRLAALLPAVVLLVLAATPAAAQSTSPSPSLATVRLELLEQTPWNTPETPMVALSFRATNLTDQTLRTLTIGLTLFGPVLSRTSYEESLLADPDPPVVVEAETLARERSIEPGGSRVFELELTLDAAGIDQANSGIYPLKVDLRSDGVSLAAIRTPVINLVRTPEQPLTLSCTLVLHQPIAFRPDGVFTTTALEDELAPGGRLAGQTRALAELAATGAAAVDVAVSPVLLTQLARMRDGYAVIGPDGLREVEQGKGGAALAGAALASLRAAMASSQIELSALPFAAPQIPSLISGGLARDLDVQLVHGRDVAGAFLQATPDPTVLRPPGGALNEITLDALDERGVSVLLLDAGTVETPLQPLGFAAPPVTSLREDGGIVGILPDPAVAALLASPLVAQDPVLGAQAVIGELAAIWQEQPGQARGLAMVLPESLDLPGGFYGLLVRGVAAAPWLHPVTARDLVAAFPPGNPNALAVSAPASFSSTYVDELKQTRRRIDVYRSMLVDESLEPDRLDTELLLAESGDFLQDPTAGFTFVSAASSRLDGVFGAVRADAGDIVTLTSRSGANIPVRVTSDAEERLRVEVMLVSQHLIGSPRQELVLDAGVTRTLTFDVDLKTTGRFPVLVQVVAPGGRRCTPDPNPCVIEETSVVVRSTAYNRVALIITIAAALVLVIAWARRFLPRRTA